MKNNFNFERGLLVMLLSIVISIMSYAYVDINCVSDITNCDGNYPTQQSPIGDIASWSPQIFLNGYDSENEVWKNINTHIDPSLEAAAFLQQALKEKTNDSAVFHVFSHGKPGQLLLNGKWSKAKEIATFLQEHITPDTKEIYLYGCNFARGGIGKKTLAYLEQALQLKIAASNNITGQNGDWILENNSVDMTAVFAGYEHSLQDSDGDSINNDVDLDDDNDGILDADEGFCVVPVQSDSWTINGTNASYDFGNGLFAEVTTSDADGFSSGNFNGSGAGFWSETLEGDVSLESTYDWNSTITINFVDASGNPVDVQNPIIHFDRVGGNAITFQNSALINLLDGLTWTQLEGTDDFEVTATTVRDGGAGVTPRGFNAESGLADAGSTAAGSLEINGLVSTLNLRLDQSGPDGSRADAIELILFACKDLDTDGDGIADYLDLDSDNDGCPDYVEGGGTFTEAMNGQALPGTATLSDGNGDMVTTNLGTLVETNSSSAAYGVPRTAGTGQTIGDSQNASIKCVDSDRDGIFDAVDLDDDNDGILDTDESDCPSGTLNLHYQNGSNLIAYDPLTGLETVVTTIPADINLNGIAYNYDIPGLIYGHRVSNPSMIVVYNPATGTWTDVGSISGADFNSGAGAYYDGVLYLGNILDDLYAVTLSADGLTVVSSTLFSTDPTGTNNVSANWGDIAIGTGCNGNPTMFMRINSGLYQIDLTTASATNNVGMFLANYSAGQLAFLDNVLYSESSTTVSQIDVCTGVETLTGFSLSAIPVDLAGGVSQCYLISDSDNDGIPNYLDLDSDNDGCPDYVEGGATFDETDGVAAQGTVTDGNGNAITDNLGNTVQDTNPAGADYGVPIVAGTGQAIGSSQNASIENCTDTDCAAGASLPIPILIKR